jgi:5-methylcytosine-specific restriction endonuclease McrA
MNDIRPKVERLRLDPITYENLRQQVLRRDGWRCQACGAMSNLEVHHREFRNHCGDDSELNLITLCTACHAQTHREGNFNPARGTKSLQAQSEWLEG